MTAPRDYLDEAPSRPPPVVIKLKSSSQPKGGEGWELMTTSDVTDADVDRAAHGAERAYEKVARILRGEPLADDESQTYAEPTELAFAAINAALESGELLLDDPRLVDLRLRTLGGQLRSLTPIDDATDDAR